MAANPQLAQAVPLEDVQAFRIYADPAYEARHGIIDHVICRECGEYVGSRLIYKDGEKGHLWAKCRMRKVDYLRKFPEAQLSCLRVSAADALRTGTVSDASVYIANRAKEYATPEEAREARRDPAYEARKQIADRVMCRICGFWVSQDLSPDHLALHISKAEAIAKWGKRGFAREYNLLYPGAPTSTHARRAQKRRADLAKVMAEYADSFATPEELEQCRRDVKLADQGDRCVCLICAEKLKEHLRNHLQSNHRKTLGEYDQLYPGAPLVCTRAEGLRTGRSARFTAAHSAKAFTELKLQLRAEQQSAEEKVFSAVNAAIPRIESLLSLPEIKARPETQSKSRVLRNFVHPDFTRDEIEAAYQASISRKPEQRWPWIGACWFVALDLQKDVETVRKYYRLVASGNDSSSF